MATKDSRPNVSIRGCIKIGIVLLALFTTFHLGFYIIVESKALRRIDTDIGMIRNYSANIARRIRGHLKQFNVSENVTASMAIDERTNRTASLPECPATPPNLVGPLATYRHEPSFAEMEANLSYLKSGVNFSPRECRTDQRVAIVIPYRNRASHLRTLLYNLHTMLERQQINYGIFVIEQAGNSTFNRGLLMNIGYTEAIKSYNYSCFVFHDVDLVPENDRIYYGCGQNPRHLSAAVDKFNYRLPYKGIVGGVTQLPRKVLQKINGFSNLYFGWGGEDDDLGIRLKISNYTVERYSLVISRYRMLKHQREKGNAPNPKRRKLLKHAAERMKTDGLNSLTYKVLNTQRGKLFTNVTVEVNHNSYVIKI
ncbi:beta-1,4-N-acetylgalactosaminyltransferase bre-4-like [Pecten maximus]|uniref:beta-1,4-N-acetylgalactosaminyltransferase bre-4-like n=1 Tax=Pecten maximus TaxID=6579 RepID=UPI0014580F9C|nr:beta-1,4-N-acetylgalactosaminyltransferase bre-4-like [Pecten maximus]